MELAKPGPLWAWGRPGTEATVEKQDKQNHMAGSPEYPEGSLAVRSLYLHSGRGPDSAKNKTKSKKQCKWRIVMETLPLGPEIPLLLDCALPC